MTTVQVDGDGYLSALVDPESESVTMEYGAGDGLLMAHQESGLGGHGAEVVEGNVRSSSYGGELAPVGAEGGPAEHVLSLAHLARFRRLFGEVP